jgi:hypothetical protein
VIESVIDAQRQVELEDSFERRVRRDDSRPVILARGHHFGERVHRHLAQPDDAGQRLVQQFTAAPGEFGREVRPAHPAI